MTTLLDAGGAPATGTPDGGRPTRRRRRRAAAVIAGALLVIATAITLVVLSGRGGSGEGAGAQADDAAFEPFVGDSAVRASMWTEAMAEGDALGAWLLMCEAGQEKYPTSADGRLLADFERFLGGRLESGEVIAAVVSDGRYYVTISGSLDTGDAVEFGVVVISAGSGMAACGFLHPSQMP